MAENVVLVEKLDLPEGVDRSKYFFAITKELSVVAIEKTKEMYKKGAEKRKAKAKLKRDRIQAKQDKHDAILSRRAESLAKRKAKLEAQLKRINDIANKKKKEMEKLSA